MSRLKKITQLFGVMKQNRFRIQLRNFVNPLTPEQGQQTLRQARHALQRNMEGFWPRQKLKLRLFLMGQVRPIKFDDAMALVSWIFVSQSVFILVGTTSFVSVLLVLSNTLSFQGIH